MPKRWSFTTNWEPGSATLIAFSEGGEAAQPFYPADQTDRRLQRRDARRHPIHPKLEPIT